MLNVDVVKVSLFILACTCFIQRSHFFLVQKLVFAEFDVANNAMTISLLQKLCWQT